MGKDLPSANLLDTHINSVNIIASPASHGKHTNESHGRIPTDRRGRGADDRQPAGEHPLGRRASPTGNAAAARGRGRQGTSRRHHRLLHGFSGGAEVREFNTPRQLPSPMPELNAAQDRIAKPLIAAISGFAFGAGLELALACHWRVASPGSRLGLPEVRLGLLPGSGGTQRLPRVVPMDVALRMMTTGDAVSAEEAKRTGLVDEIITGDLVHEAVEFAKALVARGAEVRRVREMPVRSHGDVLRMLDETRSKLAPHDAGPAGAACNRRLLRGGGDATVR